MRVAAEHGCICTAYARHARTMRVPCAYHLPWQVSNFKPMPQDEHRSASHLPPPAHQRGDAARYSPQSGGLVAAGVLGPGAWDLPTFLFAAPPPSRLRHLRLGLRLAIRLGLRLGRASTRRAAPLPPLPPPLRRWLPDPNDLDDDDLTKIKEVAAPSLLEIALRKCRAAQPPILAFIDSGPVLVVFMLMTFWALFASEVHMATTTSDKYDIPFAWVSLTFMVLFGVEVLHYLI